MSVKFRTISFCKFRIISFCKSSPCLFVASRSQCFFLLSLLLPHIMQLSFPLEAKWCLQLSLPNSSPVLWHQALLGSAADPL